MKEHPFSKLSKYLLIFVFCELTSQVWSQPDKGRRDPLKALDFSLDNDSEPDDNSSYTHASIHKENLPPSFTICTAFMVEAWNEFTEAPLYIIRNEHGEIWHWLGISLATTFTRFGFQFKGSSPPSNQSEILIYPLQCTMVPL